MKHGLLAERLADEELMQLIGERDPIAFEVFYDRHGGVAYSLAYRIVGERGAAEDVIQEAEHDMLVRPDENTIRMVPWASEPTAGWCSSPPMDVSPASRSG